MPSQHPTNAVPGHAPDGAALAKLGPKLRNHGARVNLCLNGNEPKRGAVDGKAAE